jgi:MFS family permease
LAVAVLTLNKTTGMSSVTSYSVMIFQKAGFAGTLGNIGDFAIKLTNLVVTLVAASLVDRVGRTWLLKIGTAGMTIGLAAIGGVLLAIERFGLEPSTTTGLFCLVAFFVMQVFYALGPGICVWLVLSELMPSRIRANGMSIALFMNQFVAWGLASSFLPWVNAWGWASMFFFFAVNGVIYFIVSLFIPETRGKTLEELEHLFDKKLGAESLELRAQSLKLRA